MSANIFRQVALDRLSSPEQLDQALRVTNTKSWVALLAAFSLLAAAAVWSVKGSVVTTAHGEGIIVRTGGVLNIVTQGGGTILNLRAVPGDKVRAGQTLATVGQPILNEKTTAIQSALSEARADREKSLRSRLESSNLRLEALARQEANDKIQIQELEEQTRIAQEQAKVQEELFKSGLSIKQPLLAAQYKVVEIGDQIAKLTADLKQINADRFRARSEPDDEDVQMRNRVTSLERQLAGAAKETNLAENVISPFDGEILEVKVISGSSVTIGQPIVSIQPNVQDLEMIGYLPSLQAKDVKPQMEIQVSPSNVKREEFGFVRGKLAYVGSFPSTPASLMRNFQNELLVDKLNSGGPVTEIRARLDEDARTVSGFAWSTSRGPNVTITSGTLCSLQVVTRRQKPITLLLPYMRNRLGLQ